METVRRRAVETEAIGERHRAFSRIERSGSVGDGYTSAVLRHVSRDRQARLCFEDVVPLLKLFPCPFYPASSFSLCTAGYGVATLFSLNS